MNRGIPAWLPKTAWAVAVSIVSLLATPRSVAADLHEAQITTIIKDVNLLPGQAAPRAATVRDVVRDGTAVRTGTDSRSELMFTDQTLARMGANTVFSFNEGTRDLNLGSGVMLVHVPKGAGGAKVVTAGVTAGVTGTTLMLEYHKKDVAKLFVLEGVVKMWLSKNPAERRDLHAGEMLAVPANATSMPEPQEFDLEKVMATALLVTDFAPLPSLPLITEEIRKQQERMGEGSLVAYDGDAISAHDPPPHDTLDLHIASLPPVPVVGGFGPEFGPLTTITQPNPYVITSGTQIMTAPTITTAGTVDQGKIYRGQQLDGVAAVYFFGSTSAFDSATNFNDLGENGNANIPMAAFKFNSLQLNGDPQITVPNGGAINLGLVAVGNITSGAAVATLTFPGMQTVFLGTENGSINLGGNLTFSNVPRVFMHARGVGSNITLGSAITGANSVRLNAEGSVQLNGDITTQSLSSFAGTDFLTGTGLVTSAFGINIHAENNLTFTLGRFAVAPGSQVMLTASNITIDASTNVNFFANVHEAIVLAGNKLTFTGGTVLDWSPGGGTADFEAGAGGIQSPTVAFNHPNFGITMISGGVIDLKSIAGASLMQAASNISINGSLGALLRVVSGGNITVGGNLTVRDTSGAVQAAGNINVSGGLLSQGVLVGGNVNANNIMVGNLGNLNGGTNTVVTAGGQGITPYNLSGPGFAHLWTVNTVQSHTAPVGIDFSGNTSSTPGTNGGFLQLNAVNQAFSTADGISSANFNGGDTIQVGQIPGNGGTFIVNANSISLTGTSISATTGIIGINDPPAGNGGTVSLNGQSEVLIQNSVVQVSSGDPVGPNRRSSAVGGNITVHAAGTAGGTAILIDNTSQLLSLLENLPAAQGGLIKVSADTASSVIGVNGTVRADRGGVDIRHEGDNGQIFLTGANLRGDIVKVAALGTGGRLTIGGGTIDADNILRLYAPGSNGQITFIANCNIRGGNELSIAANIVRINDGVSVNVTGHIADVYTNSAQYVGGNNATTGAFTGLGANTHLNQLPPNPIGPPGGN